MMRRIQILLYVIFALLFIGVPAMAANPEISIDAADLEYDLEAKAVVATGNVVLRSEDLEIRTEKLAYYDTGWVEAEGQSFIKSATGEYQGEGIRYHIPSRVGEIQKIKGKDEPYYISGHSGKISPLEKTIISGRVTRCDRPRPCYYLHAGRIRLTNGRVIIERGWLSILGIPVFPVPYANLSDDIEGWPDVKIGLNKERGLYVNAKQSFAISPKVSFLGGLGLGTEEWWSVEGGLRWRPSANSLGEIVYATESEKQRADLKFSTSVDPFRLTVKAFQEWDEVDEGFWQISGRWRVWQKDNKKVYLDLTQEYRRARDEEGIWYGGDMPGARVLYSPHPNWMVGYGVRYGDDNLQDFGVEGWSNEVSLNVHQKLGEKWRVEFDGAYQWKGSADHWIRQEVGVTRLFHCNSATVSWDGVENEWHFSIGMNW